MLWSFRLTVISSSVHIMSRRGFAYKVPQIIQRIKDIGRVNNVALIDSQTGQSFTYGQLDEYSTKFADYIEKITPVQSDSPAPCSIGALNMPGLTFTVSMLAAWKLHRIFVPLSITHSPNEINYVIADSGVGLVICREKGDLRKEVLSQLTPPIVEELSFSTSSTSLNKKAAEQPLTDDKRNAKDAVIIYTSGTTGRPKGVVHSHDGLEHMIRSLTQSWQYQPNDKILHFLPLYHMHGLLNKLLCVLWAGGTVEFMSSASPAAIWNRLSKESEILSNCGNTTKPLTLFMGVPTVYARMLEYSKTMDNKQKEEGVNVMRKMRLMACGSAALPDVVMNNWKELTGQVLLERYGMTEIGMALSNSYMGDRLKGFVGKPLPYVKCRLMDEHGKVITTANTPGELQIAGPCVFKQYLNREVETKESFTEDGWFKTGDISEVSADGNYKILGRSSTDIIKSSGFKISGLEIERELLSHPLVMEAAVVSVADVQFGETIVAVLVIRGESTETLDQSTKEEITKSIEKYLLERLAKYKTPRIFHLVQTIPRNHLGKVNKKTLLKELNLI